MVQPQLPQQQQQQQQQRTTRRTLPAMTMILAFCMGVLFSSCQERAVSITNGATSNSNVINMILEKEAVSTPTPTSRPTMKPTLKPTMPPTMKPTPQEHAEPLHLLVALSGTNTAFFEEWEVCLKSILLNAPHHAPLQIHVLADAPIMKVMQDPTSSWQAVENQYIQGWPTRQGVQIHFYNVEPFTKSWKQSIDARFARALNVTGVSASTLYPHTLGSYFRLLADEVLDTTVVQNVMYLDTDAVIMENLDILTPLLENAKAKGKYFSWGQRRCAGVMHINVPALPDMWNMFQGTPVDVLKSVTDYPVLNDQIFLRAIELAHPDVVGQLHDEWDSHAADIASWHGKNFSKIESFAGVSMLHYNGAKYYHAEEVTDYEVSYWKSHIVMHPSRQEEFKSNWRLALYYVHMPWHWARHMAASHCVHDECVPVEVLYHNPTPKQQEEV